jgi:sugar lactone lactonase YvrE
VGRLTASAVEKKTAAIGLLLIMAGCQGPVSPTASPSAHASATPSPLSTCPAAPAPAGPQVLLRNLPAPDDLAFDNNGRLLFSDIIAGTVSALRLDGSVERIAGGLSTPEGIVVQQDGRILVAEQGRNRVVAVDPQSHAVSLWHAFPNRTGREGIDGIGPAMANGDIVVPDSPHGLAWRVSANGKTATQIASGMDRPVGAAADATGQIFIADEGGALWALDPARHRFAALSTPDDVGVGRDGHIFVNTLGDNAIHELDAQAHQVSVVPNIQQPQGIALDGADNLYFTEFTSGRIDRVVRTFVLDTPTVSRTVRGTFVVCPSIRRAAGFTTPLMLLAPKAPGATLQLVQPGADSSGALEVQTQQTSIGITVNDGGLLSVSQTVQLSP